MANSIESHTDNCEVGFRSDVIIRAVQKAESQKVHPIGIMEKSSSSPAVQQQHDLLQEWSRRQLWFSSTRVPVVLQ